MTLWLILILMTAAALAAVAWPFAFGGGLASSGSDVAIYKDQLVEIDRDREAGLIGVADAEAARIEVSRRLLRAAESSASPPPPAEAGAKITMHQLAVLATAMVLLPILAGGMYFRLGSHGVPSVEPIADQVPASSGDDASINALIAEVEKHLKAEPNDGRGWEVLAPVYMRLGRYEDSARAWQSAISRLGDSADREESLGESLVAAANGTVTDKARAAFDRALAIDDTSVTARFYVGLAAKQDGRRDDAAKIWRDLIAAAPADAGWVDSVRDALARLDEPSAAATETAPAPNEQQNAMIRSMVERLSERLKANGDDPDGWVRLVRSYGVLGDRTKAGAAVTDARRALASDSDKLAQFEKGLKSIEAPPESAATMAATPEHDATMQAMVDKLAERLSSGGGDVDNWLMLVRSYETLGERDRAASAVAQARRAFASNPEKLSLFDQLLRSTDNASSSPSQQPTPAPAEAQKPAAVDATTAEQRMAMIKGMVDGLAERLKQDGHDVDGWIRLMRSYVVLGQRDKATAAGQSARIALSNDPEALRRLDNGAKELGVDLP